MKTLLTFALGGVMALLCVAGLLMAMSWLAVMLR